MTEKDTDFQKIKKLIKIMKDNDLVEIEIKHSDDKILLKRFQPQQTAVAMPMIGRDAFLPAVPEGGGVDKPDSGVQKPNDLVEIKSPIVGTFYATPSPDAESFVETGSGVNPQTVVCIIEAMKVMNEIKAETSGKIVEILATNGQAVEFGQVLFRVKPD